MALTMVRPADRVVAGITTTVRQEGATTVVVLRGEADSSTTMVLSDALSRVIAAFRGDVVVDLSGTEFVDTATIRTLAVASQLLGDRDRRLTFRSPTRLAARMLDLFGLSQLIQAREGALS
jgi:anti-sigma B factor antagonist